ncbi:M23 family metallopeptidase [Bacillus sp. T33-2]|uniref:M23 family metallopeptidase n=1 Tax=Bacillus sp. T33-2 TaxID=2054168 RepID=UPI000C755B35|nr:M23 family metallopeptidase [Bacillus sp. T33-2]PLR94508.1 peptidase M23 [Bacillus sp. T33-2]
MREEETKRSSQDSRFKRYFKKRWIYPAVYIASAALILTGVLWYQNSGDKADQLDYKATDVPGKKYNDEPAVEVNRAMENFVMPVTDPDAAEIKMEFYDNDSDKQKQEAALVFYNNTYHPSTGLDIAVKDGKEFNVLAAMGGTVTKVEEDAFLGNVIEIEHDKGIVTQYQSVKDFEVKVGDQVEQAQVLGKAGQSLINEKAGVHVHFEIRKDNIPVNPLAYFNKPLSALQDAKLEDDSQKASEEDAAEKGEQSEEGTSPEEGSSSEKEETGDKEGTGTDKGTDKQGSGSGTDTGNDEGTGTDKQDIEKDASESKDSTEETDSTKSSNS